MNLHHYSGNIYYRNPYGAVPCETPVLLRCEFTMCPGKPCLHVRYEAYERTNHYSFISENVHNENGLFYSDFLLSAQFLSRPGLYFYWFSSECGEHTKEYQITVYEKDLNVPDWFINTVIYQIFPDRFCKGIDENAVAKPGSFMYTDWYDLPYYVKDNKGQIARWEFFGGNLKGIQDKLSYIKNLGADTVYINPIFEARSNHRYDTADYYKVDSLLGGDKAFDSLIRECKKEDVHVILDGVFNHTGKCSKYFESCKNPDSPYKDWFTFHEDGTYDCWWGVDDLPAINKTSKSFADFVASNENSVVRYWSKRGISGWRLDVADELSDVLLQKIREAADKELGNSVIIGEVWENASNKVSYGQRKMYFCKKELHTHTNYVFRDTLLSFFSGKSSGNNTAAVFESIRETYPRHNFLAQVNMTGSHDVERLFTLMKKITNGDNRLARELVKCYSLIQFASAGVPLVYYGDETCLEGGKDPDNRRTYPWGKEDTDMIAWFAGLAKFRKNSETLVWGDAEYFSEADGNVFAILRHPFDSKEGKSYMAICDRFGRGVDFINEKVKLILEKVDNFKEKSYIIEKVAGGYGMLVSLN